LAFKHSCLFELERQFLVNKALLYVDAVYNYYILQDAAAAVAGGFGIEPERIQESRVNRIANGEHSLAEFAC
jgi:hypothetical protein